MDTRPLDRNRILRKPSDIGDEIRRELEKRGLRAPKLGKFNSDWLSENTEHPQNLIEKYAAAEETELHLHEPQDNDAEPTSAELADTIVDIPVHDDPLDVAERVRVAEAEDEIEGGLVDIQEHDEVPAEEEVSAPEETVESESSDPEARVDIQVDQEALDEDHTPARIKENGGGSTQPLVAVQAQDVALDEEVEASGQNTTEKNGGQALVDRKEAALDEEEIASAGKSAELKIEELPETEEFPQAHEQNSDPAEEHSPESHARDRFDEPDSPFTIIINKEAPTQEPEEDLPQTAELDLEILALLDSYQNVQSPTSHRDEKRSEAVESLLSTASHELRTPLQTITGFLELLLSGKVTDTRQVEQFMRIAYREGKYLADRIADLEAASQIEAGTLKINPGKLAVPKVIKSSLHTFTAQTWDRAISYDESNSAELPEIYADEHQLKHALINVIGIALKAAPFGGEVFVRAFLKEKDIIVQVISGSGNSSEKVEDPQMEENGATPKGLGIFVAGNILADHGGSLLIKGSSEELLIFELLLPIEPKAKTKGTILITDDNPQAAQMLEIALEKEGYSPIMATNGLEALEIVANDNVDLVILDVILPGMDGFEVCYRMRSAPETASIPVVIASAKIEPEDQSKALRVGADAYFQKPLVLSELLGSIEDLLVNAGDISSDEKLPDSSSGAILS